MITLIGGGGHLVVQGFLEESAYEGFTFFEFVRIGLPIALISFIWLMFFGIKDLAVREVDESNIPDTAAVSYTHLYPTECPESKTLHLGTEHRW